MDVTLIKVTLDADFSPLHAALLAEPPNKVKHARLLDYKHYLCWQWREKVLTFYCIDFRCFCALETNLHIAKCSLRLWYIPKQFVVEFVFFFSIVVTVACSWVTLPCSVWVVSLTNNKASPRVCACVWRFILCMASGLMKLVGGKQGLFNGSHDITFSLDYRRLDDGSSPVYGNNRWANRKDWGFCLIAFVRPL